MFVSIWQYMYFKDKRHIYEIAYNGVLKYTEMC